MKLTAQRALGPLRRGVGLRLRKASHMAKVMIEREYLICSE